MAINVAHSTVALSETTLHVAGAEQKRAAAVMFLYGRPPDRSAWLPVITAAART